jgi:HEAT repeat protein
MSSRMHLLKRMVVTLAILTVACPMIQPAGLAQDSAAEIERKCIEILRSDVPPAEKAIPCKQLAIYGSKNAVPALSPLLSNPELASWARIALEAIPDAAAEDALRQAATRLDGRLLIGVLNSLGVRRVEKAVPLLINALSNSNTEVASAAAAALGRIGNDAAAAALTLLLQTASAGVRTAVAEACILCAEQRLNAGRHAEALSIYKAVRAADISKQKSREATRGMILAMRSDGVPELVKLLQSEYDYWFGLGLQVAREIPGPAVAKELVRECKVGQERRRGYLLLALAERGDAEALPVAMEMALQGPTPSRHLAINILDRLADPSSAKTLLQIAAENHEVLSPAARHVLGRLPGAEVDQSVVALMNDPKAETRSMAIDLAVQRRIGGLVPALYKAAKDSDEGVRLVALKSLGTLAELDDIERLVGLLVNGQTPAEIRQAESMVVAVSERHAQMEPGSIQIVKALYGDLPDGQSKNVTKIVAEMVAAGALEIAASNSHFGDTAPGVVKSLQIDYKIAERMNRKSVPENGVLTLTSRTVPPECTQAVLSALPKAPLQPKLALLHILGGFGGPAALKAIRTATADADAGVRETALRALFDWPTADALPDLAQLSRKAPNASFKILALRGYIRLIQAQEALPKEKLEALKDAWSLAERDDEKKRVLAALGTIPTVESLAMIEPHLDNPALKEEAAATVLSVALNLRGSRPEQVTAALEKVLKVSGNDLLQKQARDLLSGARP